MDDAASRFIERMGLLAEEDGLSRIGGRLLGYLLLHDGCCSLDDLAAALQVSKASVSTNARVLERLGMVERLGLPGDRRDYYRIGDCPWDQLFDVVRRRIRRTRDLLAEGADTLPPALAAGRRRLEEWRRFYAFLLEELDLQMERWRKSDSVCRKDEGLSVPEDEIDESRAEMA